MSGKIIHILCEGQTEQGFVKEVLKPYLLACGIDGVKSTLLTTSKKKNASGGLFSYNQVLTDLTILLKSNVDGDYERHIFTTMFDLYALRENFPGYEDATKIPDRYDRVSKLESELEKSINDPRFIPYIQLHEFEALVFCGIPFLKDLYPCCVKGCKSLEAAIRIQPNPELINDGADTAPSKRIIKAIEQESKTPYRYNKPKSGKYVTEKVGIEELKKKCSHFSQWVEKLIQK